MRFTGCWEAGNYNICGWMARVLASTSARGASASRSAIRRARSRGRWRRSKVDERGRCRRARRAANRSSSRTRMTGSPRSWSGCRRGSTARRRRRPRAWRRSSSALKARTSLPIVTEDERLSSREAESRLAVHERDWRKRKKKLDAAAAAVILQDYLDRATEHRARRPFADDSMKRCVVAHPPRARRRRRRGASLLHARQPAVPRLRRRRAVRRDPARRGQRRASAIAVDAASIRDLTDLSHRALDERQGPPAEGRRVPLRPRHDAVRSASTRSRAATCYVIHVTFPEGLTMAEMAKIFESQGLGPAAAFRAGGEGSVADSRARSGGEGSRRAICSLKPTRCRAGPTRRSSSRLMVGRFEHVFTPELRARGRRAQSVGSPGGDAGVDRRKGNRHAPTSGRSSRPSTATGCGSACRCSAIRR